jgi:hypothetical protein
MRRASPSPGTPFSVLTGPTTSGSQPRTRSALRLHLPTGAPSAPLMGSGAISRGKAFAPRFEQTRGLGRSCCVAIGFFAWVALGIFM